MNNNIYRYKIWLITCQYIDQWIDKHATMPHRHDISHMCEKNDIVPKLI